MRCRVRLSRSCGLFHGHARRQSPPAALCAKGSRACDAFLNCPARGSLRVGTGKKSRSVIHKTRARKAFEARHVDQVWEDVRKEYNVVAGKYGPMGTTDRCAMHARTRGSVYSRSRAERGGGGGVAVF